MTLVCSFFTHAKDNCPDPWEGAWQELVAILERTNTPRSVPPGDNPKTGLPAIAGARFEPQHRGKEDAQSIQLLGLDYDNATEEVIPGELYKSGRMKTRKVMITNPVTMEEVANALSISGIAAYFFTTWSNQGGWPKFRIMVPLAVPVPAGQWTQAAEWALSRLGLSETRRGLDMGALRDVARIYFLPGHPDGADAIHRLEIHGRPLDVPLDELSAVKVLDLPAAPHIQRERDKRKADGYAWAGLLPIDVNTLRLADLLATLGVQVGQPRPFKEGTKWRAHCLWPEEHSHAMDDDSAFVIHEPGRWPTHSCSHACHEGIVGLVDVIRAAQAEGINLLKYADAREKAEDEPKESRVKTSDRAVRLAIASGAELWHDSDQAGFMSIIKNGHKENHPIKSKSARMWLTGIFYSSERRGLSAQECADALCLPVYRRVQSMMVREI